MLLGLSVTTMPDFELGERNAREVNAATTVNADARVLLDRVVGLCTDKVSLARLRKPHRLDAASGLIREYAQIFRWVHVTNDSS